MSKTQQKRYRVAQFFAHDGELVTNSPEDRERIAKMPQTVVDHHVKLGNLVEVASDDAPATSTDGGK